MQSPAQRASIARREDANANANQRRNSQSRSRSRSKHRTDSSPAAGGGGGDATQHFDGVQIEGAPKPPAAATASDGGEGSVTPAPLPAVEGLIQPTAPAASAALELAPSSGEAERSRAASRVAERARRHTQRSKSRAERSEREAKREAIRMAASTKSTSAAHLLCFSCCVGTISLIEFATNFIPLPPNTLYVRV